MASANEENMLELIPTLRMPSSAVDDKKQRTLDHASKADESIKRRANKDGSENVVETKRRVFLMQKPEWERETQACNEHVRDELESQRTESAMRQQITGGTGAHPIPSTSGIQWFTKGTPCYCGAVV
jgi:hypothetical protein